jgi:hypothetical protein
MQNTGDVPEPTIWLGREYARRLAFTGVRRLPRMRGTIEVAQTKLREYFRDYNDIQMLEALDKINKDEGIKDLLQAGSRLGLGGYLSGLSVGMEPALQRLNGGKVYPALVAEQATDDFNASVLNTASGFLIMVGNGVPYFINQCAKVAGYACPEFVRFPGDIEYRPEQAPDGSQMDGGGLFMFCCLTLGMQLVGYLGDANPSALSFLPQPHPTKLKVIQDIVVIAERFIIGHEHGHIANNHLVAPTIEDDVPLRTSNQEFEADAFSVDLLTTSEMSKVGMFGSSDVEFDVYIDRAIGGFALFCAADHLVHVATQELLIDAVGTSTHPSAIARWEAIKDRLSNNFANHINFGDSLFEFFRKVAPLAAEFCAVQLKRNDTTQGSIE